MPKRDQYRVIDEVFLVLTLFAANEPTERVSQSGGFRLHCGVSAHFAHFDGERVGSVGDDLSLVVGHRVSRVAVELVDDIALAQTGRSRFASRVYLQKVKPIIV